MTPLTINACVHQAPTANVAHATCAQKSRNWILVRSKMIISGLALRAPPTSRCHFFKWHLNVGCATRAVEISANRNEYSKIKHFWSRAFIFGFEHTCYLSTVKIKYCGLLIFFLFNTLFHTFFRIFF